MRLLWKSLAGLMTLGFMGVVLWGLSGRQEFWWQPLDKTNIPAQPVEDFALPDLPAPSQPMQGGYGEGEVVTSPAEPARLQRPDSQTSSRREWVTYETQSGDTLEVVAVRFGVRPEEIETPPELSREGLLSPGRKLRIPWHPVPTTTDERLFPDSELVLSPSSVGFDVHGYVQRAGGYLAGYEQYLPSPGQISGAEVVQFVARNYAISPRVLLALLEYQARWVMGTPPSTAAEAFPLGHRQAPAGDLYRQLRWAAEQLAEGYYGWREGRLTYLTFADGEMLFLAPSLNAGTVALMYYFAALYPRAQWEQVLNPSAPESFLALYHDMFGDPWQRARLVEPLYPPDLQQPEMVLPFSRNAPWFLTSGPHGAYGNKGAWAALDFAPLGGVGCRPSYYWVLAAAPGLVVRSEKGIVVLDLDGDGHEETGWVLFYLHIATQDRVPAGTLLERDDFVGHPSCEGGRATGTHVHIARRYNGEWMAAAGPVPFVLGGWQAYAGDEPRVGFLKRGEDIVQASMYGGEKARIIRGKNDP